MRPEKQLLLDELNEMIDTSSSMIVARYDRLNPQQSWDLSEQLNKSKSNFKVVKKRILYKAAEDKNLPFKADKFDGHIGVVFIQGDSLDAAKTVVKFQEDNEELIEIITGQIDGKVCTKEEIKILSTLPSKDEMRAQLLGLFQAPLSETLSVMESLLTSVMHCLENKKDKESSK